MRKNKWKKVLIWLVSIIVILGVGGLFAANYAADKLIASLAESLEGDLLDEDVVAVVPDQSLDGQVDDNGNNSGDTNNATDSTPPSDKSTSESKGSGDIDYKPEVSTDKVKDVQEKITVSEKAKLTAVFLKQLSMEDIKALQELANGGLSKEEKKEARTLILDRLSPEQYDDLIQIAKKYGMSKGKTYDEVANLK